MSYVQRKLPHQMNGLSVVKMEEFELSLEEVSRFIQCYYIAASTQLQELHCTVVS